MLCCINRAESLLNCSDCRTFFLVHSFLFFPWLQLDESKDFEERKLIRAAMRDLRKKKRGEESGHSLFVKKKRKKEKKKNHF